MKRRKVGVSDILYRYNAFYKYNKPDLTTRAGRRGARGEVNAIIQDLSRSHPRHKFRSARSYVREMRKMQEANEARGLYNLQQKAASNSNSITDQQRQQIQEGLKSRKTRRWFRKFRRWDEENFKEQSANMYADTERNFKAKTRSLINYPVSEDKMRYINNLNRYAYLPDQNREEFYFEGVRGPADLEVVGYRPKPKSAKTNIDPQSLNQEIADIEYALRTNDFSKFYNNPLYYKSRKDFEDDDHYYSQIGRWARAARQDVRNNGYQYSGNMTEKRLSDLGTLSATLHEDSNEYMDFINKPITQEDLIWLQNAPFYRENIITSLQNRLNELRK